MEKLLDRRQFEIDINEYNPNGFALLHVETNEKGEPADITFVYVNEHLAALENTTKEALTGKRFFELYPNAPRERLSVYYKAAYEGVNTKVNIISEEEDRYLHLDVYPVGTEGYCTCILSNIKSNYLERENRRKYLEGLVSDLEHEREVNAKVRAYASAVGLFYPLAIELDYLNNSYHMVEYDNFINREAPVSGKIDDLIGYGMRSVPDPELSRRFYELFNREATVAAFRRGEREIVLRHPQTREDGSVHWMDTRVIQTAFGETEIKGISLARIIDDDMAREEALRLEARHAEVINAISTIYTTIMEADIPSHGYRAVKAPMLMKTATSGNSSGNFDTVVESVLHYFMHPDDIDRMRKFLDLGTLSERLNHTNTVHTEYRNTIGLWFEARFIVQKRDEAGHAITALYVARSVAEEKEREFRHREELRKAALEAERANSSKTGFLRRMSHDIRTPLNGIMGMLHIAERNRGDLEKTEECLDKIRQSTNYLIDIVNNVLEISKLESGAIILESKPFDLGALLLSSLSTVSTNASENGLTFLGGRDGSVLRHRNLIGSPVHLNRVLMNVASNAIKYNRPGGSIRLLCRELGDDGELATYEFICEDTGLGMSEEFQKRAFEPFTQEGKQTTTSFSGSGLGLSIVKDIVSLMGGTVELSSKENEGTTMRLVIPFKIDKSYAPMELKKPEPANLHLEGKHALLVEDNDLNLEIARIMLEELGLTVTEAKNGLEAVESFEFSEPYTFDYVFMDMMMPVMDGLEATRAIRALPREDAASVPIIAMTANAFLEDRRTCLEAGMNEHIGKPMDLTKIREVLGKI